tara:strand:+ start:297 stop:692 length:396 start_codon:yes stop_codon:yes gene_type:complete
MCLFGDDTKECVKCGKELTLDNFGPSSGGVYLRSECKGCINEAAKLVKILRKKISKPKETYTCPICEKNVTEIQGGAWCLDHCHETKTFRGWLCHKCNRALGNFDDNAELLIRAINYLRKDYDNDTEQTLL